MNYETSAQRKRTAHHKHQPFANESFKAIHVIRMIVLLLPNNRPCAASALTIDFPPHKPYGKCYQLHVLIFLPHVLVRRCKRVREKAVTSRREKSTPAADATNTLIYTPLICSTYILTYFPLQKSGQPFRLLSISCMCLACIEIFENAV